MKLLFLDTETTGTDKKKHGIHQISGSIVIDNNIVEVFDIKFKPFEECEYDSEALKVINCSKEDLQSREINEKEAYQIFNKILAKYVNKFDKKDKFFLIGYNVHFDKDFLYEMFIRCNDKFLFSYIWGNHIDVMVLSTVKLLSLRSNMENFKQGTVAKYLGFQVSDNSLHDALYDIYICIGLYCYVTDTKFNIKSEIINNSDIENKLLLTLQNFAQPLKNFEDNINDKIISFGKYKNSRLGDIIISDPQYLIWLYENAQNQNLISFNLYQKLKNNDKKKYRESTNDKVIDYQLDNYLDSSDF